MAASPPNAWESYFNIVDLSLAPTPKSGTPWRTVLEELGLETVGTHGTVAALALLNDAVKKGGLMACSHVGGLSGSFIPISEDIGMIESAAAGHITLDKLEAMTAICSVGLDMVAVPGDTPAATLAAMIADEAAIGVMNHKTTAVRVIPAVGLGVGDTVEFGGLLGAPDHAGAYTILRGVHRPLRQDPLTGARVQKLGEQTEEGFFIRSLSAEVLGLC